MENRAGRAAVMAGLAVLLAIASAVARAGTPVGYTGASGGYWSVPGNWSTGVVPMTAGDDVTISTQYVHFDLVGSTAIDSLAMSAQATLNLSANCNLTVLNDAPWNQSSLVCSANFSAPNITNIDASSLNANGAVVSLAALAAYNSGSTGNPQWQANGAGGQLTLPALLPSPSPPAST